MIPLRLPIKAPMLNSVIVTRLTGHALKDAQSKYALDSILKGEKNGWCTFKFKNMEFCIQACFEDIDNDVLMLVPDSKTAQRLIRGCSPDNSLLVTEQCDQLCVMCSQPPKKHHIDYFSALFEACILAPSDATLGITGGEPLLYKYEVFALIAQTFVERPDIKFHVLTNGQHFAKNDLVTLNSPAFQNVLWAIPVYSSSPEIHDRIVGKSEAFLNLMRSFLFLSKSLAQIELRTVVMKSNENSLAELADFLSRNIPFASFWSIMQMERIGYGRLNWQTEFVDTSKQFENVARAVNITQARGLDTRLYNFPLCTVPKEYQVYCVPAISDWKKKFESFCLDCELIKKCGGFFEWYKHNDGFVNVRANEET